MERALLGISTVFCYFPTVDLVYFLPSSGDSSPVGALKCRDEGPQMGLAWLLAGVRWHEDWACGLETSKPPVRFSKAIHSVPWDVSLRSHPHTSPLLEISGIKSREEGPLQVQS